MSKGESAFSWPDALQPTIRRLQEAGLDLVHPFSVSAAQTLLGPRIALPQVETESPLGLIVGNSRALWTPFVTSREAAQKDPPLPHPLDRYVERSLGEALELSGLKFNLAYSHTLLPQPIPLQRIADAAGFAHLGPAHLSVHPTYGLWLALRAVVVLEFPFSDAELPPGGQAPRVCEGCLAPCTGALEEALQHHSEPPAPKHVQLATSPLRLSNHAQAWARIREVCPIGQEHKFSGPQMKYHYDKSRVALFTDNLRRLHPER